MRIVHFEKEGVAGIAVDDGSGWHGLTKQLSRHSARTDCAGCRSVAQRLAEGLLVEAHESDLSVASDVTQARVAEALKLGAETYEAELEMEFLSRLSLAG
jgi:hypothetical protein